MEDEDVSGCDFPSLSLWAFGLSSQHDGAAHASFQGFSSSSNAIIVCLRDTHTHTYHDRWTALLMHWTSALPHWISKWNWFMMRDDQSRSGQDASGFRDSGHYKNSFPMPPLACQPSTAYKPQMFVKGIIRKQTHFLSLTQKHTPTSPLNHETFPLSIDCSFFSFCLV